MTGAVPSTSQSSDHACFRQRVGPGQAWDATTRRGWVIAAWVLAGRAGSGATHQTARTCGSDLRHRLSRSTNTSTGCSCQHSYPQFTSLKRGCWPGTWGDERGLRCVVGASPPGCRGEPTPFEGFDPNASGRDASALSTARAGPCGIIHRRSSMATHLSADPQCIEHGGSLAQRRIARGPDYRCRFA